MDSLIERLTNIDPADTPCMAKELATEAATAIEKLRAALRPFAGHVFNDNGDMTINMSAPTSEEYIAAYFAMKKTA
jgi:hypothetical protein